MEPAPFHLTHLREDVMRKLKLEIEDLAVESFATGAGAYRAGTVRGRNGEDFVGFGEGIDEVEIGDDAEAPETRTCPVITHCASCVHTCDACTVRTCAAGGEICCA